jgi:hypothetical protein
MNNNVKELKEKIGRLKEKRKYRDISNRLHDRGFENELSDEGN